MEYLEGLHRGEGCLAPEDLLELGPYDAFPPSLMLGPMARGHA